MTTHGDKIHERLSGSGTRAPRDIEWNEFKSFWNDVADEVVEEKGDRLAVKLQGHREVFHRPHNGLVSIEDVERTRHLLAAHPNPKGAGSLLVVSIDAKKARIIRFDLSASTVVDPQSKVGDADERARHLRTVERRAGHDDEADLQHFFDELAEEIRAAAPSEQFVVIGHGQGKSDVVDRFVERLRTKHRGEADLVAAIARIDLSAATDADIEAAAQAAVK